MPQNIHGVIRDIYYDDRVFTIRYNNRVHFFYLQRSMMKNFCKYLKKGTFVSFVATNKTKVISTRKAILVSHFLVVKQYGFRKDIVFYNYNHIKDSIRKLISTNRNRLFIDLEMTLPDYKKSGAQEIIQFGLVLEDDQGRIIMEDFDYIQPTLSNGLNSRTKRFLDIDEYDLRDAIKYTEFYDRVQHYIKEYDPIIYVWGRNDIIALNKSYKINKMKKLIKRSNMIDLLKLQKTYFNLKNDLGLFNAYNMYTGNKIGYQSHDALEDALITRKVFAEFLKIVNNEKKFEIPKGVK